MPSRALRDAHPDVDVIVSDDGLQHYGLARDFELVVFDHLSHAGLHEDPEAFNRATLDFLLRHAA